MLKFKKITGELSIQSDVSPNQVRIKTLNEADVKALRISELGGFISMHIKRVIDTCQ